MNGLGYAIAYAAGMALVTVVAFTVVITATLIIGMPYVWALLKPWLHSITG